MNGVILWSRWRNDKAIHVASVWFLLQLTRLKVVARLFIVAISGLFVSPGCHCTWPQQSGCDWQMPGEIRSSELRWAAVALNTPLQLSDVDREMGQTFQMRKQLSLISHYQCRLLRVSGFSSRCSWLCLARQFWRERRSAKDIPLKPRVEPRRETESNANSLSAMLKIFPIMGAELDWRVAVEWGLHCKGWSHSHSHKSQAHHPIGCDCAKKMSACFAC